MSLGLKDLQKKRRPQTPANPTEHQPAAKAEAAEHTAFKSQNQAERTATVKTPTKTFGRPAFGVRPKIPVGAWAAKSVTARPWTDNGLSKAGRARKSTFDPEAAMNEEWINLFSTPWFWVECAPESRIIRLQQQLMAIEEQIEQKLRDSFSALRRFIGG